jgi:hypothetical protein
VLVVPNLVSGNILAKSLSFVAGADSARIVLGTQVPIILTSRTDSLPAAAGVLCGGIPVAAAQRRGQQWVGRKRAAHSAAPRHGVSGNHSPSIHETIRRSRYLPRDGTPCRNAASCCCQNRAIDVVPCPRVSALAGIR